MLNKYNRYKVLKVFLDKSNEEFGLREISRACGISPLSVLNYLREFENDKFIKKFDRKGKPSYTALRESENFIFYKKIGILYELHESGLIEELWSKLSPKAIILYGSYAKGEALENSDIDIFIIGKESKIDLSDFEKRLGRSIHLMFQADATKISNELKNNLINGVILKGYLEVF